MQFLKGTDADLQELLKSPELVVDLETTGLNPRKDRVLEVVLGVPGVDTAYIFEPEAIRALIMYKGLFIGHNIIDFDQAMMIPYGVHMYPERVFDTLLTHHLYDENMSHSLDSIIQATWGDGYKKAFWSKHKEYADAPEQERLEYAGKDVIYTGRLYLTLSECVRSGEIDSALIRHVHRLAFALSETSRRGIKIDLPYLTEIGVKLKTRLNELGPLMRASAELDIKAVEYDLWLKELDKRKTVKGRAGVPKPEFNFDSPKQLGSLLYDKIGLPVQLKKRKVTTDFDALENIKDRHSLVALLQEQREKGKLYGTYVEGMADLLEDGRVYPEFMVNGTVTGRISHAHPNVANLPKEGGLRGMYIPEPGMGIISADFSQLEVCIAAHFTQDKALLSMIFDGASMHDITAAGLGCSRSIAKAINFAMQYGASAWKVSSVLGVSKAEGEHAFNKYWETYAGVKREMDACAKCVDDGIPIVTLFGRKRRFENKARAPWDKAYRQAWNAKVQGTGSDMTSVSFYRVHEAYKKNGWGYGLFTVHDELLTSSLVKYALDAEKLLCETMVNIGKELQLTVPIKVESSGLMDRWND